MGEEGVSYEDMMNTTKQSKQNTKRNQIPLGSTGKKFQTIVPTKNDSKLQEMIDANNGGGVFGGGSVGNKARMNLNNVSGTGDSLN